MSMCFCSALTTAGASRRRSPVRHFLYPLQLLLGGLLIEAEAGEIALRLWPTHQQWERCPRWLKIRSDHRWDRLSRSGSLLLRSLVKQFDRPPGQLPESGRLLWRVAWHCGPERVSWHSLNDHSPLRRRSQQWTPSRWDFSDPPPPLPFLKFRL